MPTLTFRDVDGAIVVDDEHAPIFRVAWFDAPGDVAVRAFFDWSTRTIHESMRANRPSAIVIDASAAARPSPKTRALIAQAMDEVPRAETLVLAFIAIPNPLVRGALTAIRWLARKPWPMTVVASADEGLTKAIDSVRERGGSPPLSLDPKRVKPLVPTRA